MNFSLDMLAERLSQFPRPQGYVIAYSGGLDSHVLLDALVCLRARTGVPVAAVHVNHGLQAAADDWQTHCAAVCHALCVTLSILRIDAVADRGESPEAAAREARYRALADWLPPGHCLLTAQHQDDQAETVLLQVLRGSGVHGLAAMPAYTAFGDGALQRPLLDFSRADLLQHAQDRALCWIEDPSNASRAFTRNFLRHEIMPLLHARWSGVSASLARSAVNHAEAASLLDEAATADLRTLQAAQDRLSIPGLLALSAVRRRNVLRYWLRQATATVPSRALLEQIERDVLASRVDAEPCVRWNGHALRRYRSVLFLLDAADAAPVHGPLHWSVAAPLPLPDGSRLLAFPDTGAGLDPARLATGVEVRWRRGGEICRPAGRDHHHALKKLFQESAVPPWERARIPLIYIGDELAAVADLWICEPFRAAAGQSGVQIRWQRGKTAPPPDDELPHRE